MAVIAPTVWRVGTPLLVRGRRWRVDAITFADECAQLRLTPLEGDARGQLSILTPFDRPAPLRITPGSRVVSRRRWLHEVDRRVISLHPFGSLATAARASIHLLPYQLEPAIAVTRFGACRLLITDGVGQGKTIQAGLILSELAAEAESFRALVLVPAGLRNQWIGELAERFQLPAVGADAEWLRRSALDRPPDVNPWMLPGVYVASHDFIKRAEALRPLERATWDVVVIDEAHLAGAATDRRAALDAVASRALRVVLLTATPNRGDPAAFTSLCRIGAAATDAAPPLLFNRRRRTVDNAPARKVGVAAVAISDAERRMHRLLEQYAAQIWKEAAHRGDDRARLVSIVLRKRALSSAFALAISLRRRAALLAAGRDQPAEAQLLLPLNDEDAVDDDERGANLGVPGLTDAERERWWLTAVTRAARAAARRESKLRWLLRFIARVREPMIVFTEYRDTLRRLFRAIVRTGRPTLRLHGGMGLAERREVPHEFSRRDYILVATDAAAEGLNLHHRCRLVVHYELPWNPARLEQRAGRVDRIGQRLRVHELALLANTRAERVVLAPLLHRSARVDEEDRFQILAGLTESRVATAVMRGVPVDPARRPSPDAGLDVTDPPAALTRCAGEEAERLARLRILMARSPPVARPCRPSAIVVTRSRRARRAANCLHLLYAVHLETPTGADCHGCMVPVRVNVRDPAVLMGPAALRALLRDVSADGMAVQEMVQRYAGDVTARVREEIVVKEERLFARMQAVVARQRVVSGQLAQPRLFGRQRARDPDEYRDTVDQLPLRSALPLTMRVALVGAIVGQPGPA